MNNAYTLCDTPIEEAEARAVADRAAGFYTLIGGLVLHPDGSLFAQRRSLTRAFGPGLWDNVGGHVELGETLRETLAREILEETGWTLAEIFRVVAVRDWQDDRGPSREYIVVCSASGDLAHPVLEQGKADKTAWISEENIQTLNENRRGDVSQLEIYAHALSLAHV